MMDRRNWTSDALFQLGFVEGEESVLKEQASPDKRCLGQFRKTRVVPGRSAGEEGGFLLF
jgi:hypothetical protein